MSTAFDTGIPPDARLTPERGAPARTSWRTPAGAYKRDSAGPS